jgi:hypothetical protein
MAGYTIRVRASVEKDIAALPRDLTPRRVLKTSLKRPCRLACAG